MENIETLLAAVAAQTQGFDDDDESSISTSPALGFDNSVSSAANRGDIARSELTGAQPEVSGDTRISTAASPADGELIGAGDKRKRGRPPRGFFAPKPQPPKRKKQEEEEEEDVCFICFDGGSLVLCDKRGCPKAYHPACIKRDEAFFKSKAKWNCGWHICSVCRKSSHYLCYTCTYSLCKGCTKDTDYLCVRGNRGFCSTCMKTIMLIENKDQSNSESIQVDFDDKTSWEYLFKVYWVILKEKLSLTLTDLTQARRPWKGVSAVAHKPQLSSVHCNAANAKVAISDKSSECLELNKPHVDIYLPQNDRLRTEAPSVDHHVEKLCSEKGEDGKCLNNDIEKPSIGKVKNESTIDKATDEPSEKVGDNPNAVEDADKPCMCKHAYDKEADKPSIDINAEWASKDLLEFVAHMKNGDTSSLSQFDVQTLMLDYIKRNNLLDPHQKSQIICDLRLKNLFGKPRVGHIEMLKLLEFHFLIKDECEKSSFIPAGFVGSIAGDMEVDGNNYGLSTPINSRKRKTRKKNEERVPQNNLDEYAAIDVHNINLIYLRRNLMENLIEDQGNFNTKVVGSIVRIRISSNDQKHDVYRLVQVAGTTKVAEPYKIGDKTANVMLEVLNLDKKEVVSIDAISNQDFTEDECRRLRQSIRCGLVKQFTVGEVQKKAMSIQVVRVNDLLEAEILRLNHLRDRASEKGRKKELREYVNKLQLLKSLEERQRRISEVPEIHADPKMSPNYVSEEDTRVGDNSNNDEYVRPNYSGFPRNGKKTISPNKKGKVEGSIQAHNRIAAKIDSIAQRPTLEDSTTTTPAGNSPNTTNIETEKLWHYRDPNGKIQGPFSMMQLRIWSTTGLFPTDMRIWTNHEQYDSVLLNDALNGLFHGASDLSAKPSSGSEEHVGATKGTVGGIVDKDGNSGDSASVLLDNNNGSVRADESWPKCLDLLKDSNPSTDDVQPILDKTQVVQPDRGQETDEINHGSQIGDNSSSDLTQNQLNNRHELQNQSDDSARVYPSSEENFRPLHIDLSSSIEPGPTFAALLNSPDSNKPDMDINLSNLPNLTPETAENQQSVESSDVPMQNSGILELLSLSPRTNSENPETETKESGSRIFSGQNPGPSWNLQQIPEIGEGWCGYSPTPPKPSSAHDWDFGPVSASSMKPPEVTNESNIIPNWLSIINEPIEFDVLGEESVSDLLAEVDAMESQGGLPSPTSAMKFARELMQDCKDDCFSSIEDFSPTPVKSDAFSSTGLSSKSSSVPFKPIDALDSFRKSGGLHSSGSSQGETNAPVYSGEAGSSEFHPPAQSNTSQDMVDPGWGTVQGNINLVTVQGNVNLVLGGPGPGQGMANLGWGANPGSAWVNNPNINQSPINGSLPWDPQRYPGERFTSPREWGGGYQGSGEPGFGRGRPPWGGRQSYGGGGGGGYLRGFQKGNRICKFYESGRCKKGAFCDYLHP